ncbi:MAG: hypothetical protein ACM3VS_19135 [Candidatus Dadabacteria bacterium]
MEVFYDQCSEEELKRMYDKADAELTQALLDGAAWEDLRYKTSLVTKISIALHKKQHPEWYTSGPADTNMRDHQGA